MVTLNGVPRTRPVGEGIVKASLRIIPALIVLLAFAGCSSPGAWSRHELCFGLSADAGRTSITDQAWQQFVDQEIVPRFSAGFTVFEAQGYWRTGGETITEPARVLMVVAPDSRETRSKLEAIAKTYVQRFRQEAVLRIQTPAEVSFHGK